MLRCRFISLGIFSSRFCCFGLCSCLACYAVCWRLPVIIIKPLLPLRLPGRDWRDVTYWQRLFKCSFVVSRMMPLYKLASSLFFGFYFLLCCYLCFRLTIALKSDLLHSSLLHQPVSSSLLFFRFIHTKYPFKNGKEEDSGQVSQISKYPPSHGCIPPSLWSS